MSDQNSIRVVAQPAEQERAFILEHLIDFNNAHSTALLTSRQPEGGRQPIQVLLYDPQEKLLGGLIGHTIWNWLDIDLFWLDESARHLGYGTQIIQAAEAEARQRGCQKSKVETYSFQARGFYEKNGYRVVGQIDDFPPGTIDYTLVKELIPIGHTP